MRLIRGVALGTYDAAGANAAKATANYNYHDPDQLLRADRVG